MTRGSFARITPHHQHHHPHPPPPSQNAPLDQNICKKKKYIVNSQSAARCIIHWDVARCQPVPVKGSNVAVVSWWLAQISRKRAGEGGRKKADIKKRERWRKEEGRRRRRAYKQKAKEREGYSYRGAPQASNSGGDGNSLSLSFFFFPSLLFSSPRPRHFIPLRLRAVLSSRGVRPVHSVVLGLPSAFHPLPPPLSPSPPTPPRLSSLPSFFFFFHPGGVVLVTFRLAVRDLDRSP